MLVTSSTLKVTGVTTNTEDVDSESVSLILRLYMEAVTVVPELWRLKLVTDKDWIYQKERDDVSDDFNDSVIKVPDKDNLNESM